jgi:ABC-type Fe3+/spermidine/putrescine transport system ATPase subunit
MCQQHIQLAKTVFRLSMFDILSHAKRNKSILFANAALFSRTQVYNVITFTLMLRYMT